MPMQKIITELVNYNMASIIQLNQKNKSFIEV